MLGVRREGYLEKQGRVFKKERKRWFELWDDRLVYFEDKDALKELGTIELQDIIEVSPLDNVEIPEWTESTASQNRASSSSMSGDFQKPSRPVFRVETSERTYSLRADNVKVMVEWIQAIRKERENFCTMLERSRQRGLSFEGIVPIGADYFKHVIEIDEAAQFVNEGIKTFLEHVKQKRVLPFPKFVSRDGWLRLPEAERERMLFATVRFKNNSNINFIKIPFYARDALVKVVEDAITKYRNKTPEMPLSAKPTNYMFKVVGFSDYLYGDEEAMGDFDYVHHMHNHHLTCEFELMKKPNEADLVADLDLMTKELERVLSVNHSTRHRRTESTETPIPMILSQPSEEVVTMPLTDVEGKFRIYLICARQLSLDSPSFSRARAMAEAAGAGLCCKVECCLSLGADLLCDPVWTEPVPGRLSVKFEKWIAFDVQTRDLPRAAKLCITLYGGVSGTRVQVPLAWINVQLFDYKGMLKQRTCSLKMWMNDKANLLATCQQNTDLTKPPPTLELGFEEHPHPVVWVGATARPLVTSSLSSSSADQEDHGELQGRQSLDSVTGNVSKVNKILGTEGGDSESVLSRIAKQDMLQDLSEHDKNTLWQRRDQTLNFPQVLPKLLRAIRWTNREQVAEMKQLLSKWDKLNVQDAIQLLDAKYAEQFVRDYAVSCLESVPDYLLEEILPQLVQAIKHEPYHSSSLARFLLVHALVSPHRVGHSFFWQLKAEMHSVAIRERYGVLLSSFMDGCSEQLRRRYMEETDLIKSLIEGARMVKSLAKAQRTATLHQFLYSLRVPPTFTLPISSRVECKGFIVEKCKVMQSATAPLFLVFENSDPYGSPIPIIFKVGDDLRQDILTLQMFQIMDRIWCDNGLDLKMTVYKCVAVDDEVGLIEVVPESETVANIARNYRQGNKIGGALAAFKQSPILDWLKFNNKLEDEFPVARENFIRSCAAYCVATYVLGIGDRHNDNVMITKAGNLFHIDFGHFLGNFQKFLGVNRDRAPFVFTPDFAFVMGGREDPAFLNFVEMCCQAYNLLRANSRPFINLFGLMLSTGIPELKTPKDLDFLRDTLQMDATDEDAAKHFRQQIYISLETKSTQFNNALHILAN